MKTFKEALEATMFRETVWPVDAGEPIVPGHPLYDKLEAELADKQNGYSEILEEIQNHPETMKMIDAMKQLFEAEASVAELMICAFSHGVMVGMEMEKQPLLVGRDHLERRWDGRPEAEQ